MNIGIDVDGVLTKYDEYLYKKGIKFFGQKDNVNEGEYRIRDMFNCSPIMENVFWAAHFIDYCLHEPMIIGMADMINQLQSEGHSIHIITMRANTTGRNPTVKLCRYILERFLFMNGIHPDTINFCTDFDGKNSKVKVCKRLNIDVMLEDAVKNIQILSEITNVICISRKYNKRIQETDRIKIASNPYEIYHLIKQFEESIRNPLVLRPRF